MKIVAAFDLSEKHVKRIEENYPVKVVVCAEPAQLRKTIRDADIIISSWSFPPRLIEAAPSLKWIHSVGAGVDGILTSDLVRSSVLITSSSGIHREPISEHVLTYMLCFSRGFHTFMRQQVQKKWNRIGLDELAGKTVGIVGLGEIGSEIALKAKCLGMRVVAVKRTVGEKPGFVDELWSAGRLKKLLEESDFIVLSIPLTKTTAGLIGDEEFKSMKKSAYFINIGRGRLVQEEKLIQALKEGLIAGAGLDVFEKEPLPTESELWEMPNVIITPHVAGSNPYYFARAMSIFEENLKRFLKGDELVNLVDKKLGY